MGRGWCLALAVASGASCATACTTDRLGVPAAPAADVELLVAAPAGIDCIDVRFEDAAGRATSRQAAIGAEGRARLQNIPVGAYQITARAYAAGDCSVVPASPPWITVAPVLLVLDAADGPATVTLQLFRARPTFDVTTLVVPWRGSFLANAMGDYLGDGSTVVLFGGPSFQNERIPFKAIRIGRDGALSDVTATLIVGAPAAVHARRALAIDLNGDGRLDFYSANHGWDHDPFPGETPTLLLSRPDGRLEDASATLPPINLFQHTTAAADVRGNGRIDILVGQLGMQNNPGLPDIYRGPNVVGDFVGPFMLRNDGAGGFAYDNTSLP
ncbi:MAG TPA: FG-GAP-like repeat-containing protein, partial [Haliangiales bacterium]|nr:FG-GAP-like repeat-containing protein [Haliangiales bacterium]